MHKNKKYDTHFQPSLTFHITFFCVDDDHFDVISSERISIFFSIFKNAPNLFLWGMMHKNKKYESNFGPSLTFHITFFCVDDDHFDVISSERISIFFSILKRINKPILWEMIDKKKRKPNGSDSYHPSPSPILLFDDVFRDDNQFDVISSERISILFSILKRINKPILWEMIHKKKRKAGL